MPTSRSLKILSVSVLALLLPAAVQAAVILGIVAKNQFTIQSGPDSGDVVLLPFNAFEFEVELQVESPSDLSNPSGRRPDGAAANLVFNADDEAYGFFDEYDSQAAMDSQYPAGNYTLSYTPAGSGSAVSKTVPLSGTFSSAPVIENWFDMRHFPANQDVTIRWNAMTGGAADDLIIVDIENRNTGDLIFETGVHYFGDPIGLDGTDRSVTVPSGSLVPNTTYDFFIQFINIESVDIGQSVPDVFFASFHSSETELNIRTVNRHPSSVVSWGLLSRWTAHRQIGPDTVEPLIGDEAAYFFASIWLDNPDDLTGATFAGRNLVKSSNGDGWEYSEPAFDESNLYSSFPNGPYDFNYSFAAGGSHFTTLDLAGGVLPEARLTNWSELQAATAGTVTPIRWMAPAGVKASDAYIVRIENGSGDIVFETELDIQSNVGLNGTDTSVDVPAGTLAAGQIYNGAIWYIRMTDFDANSQADAYFVAANGVETRFTINTGAASNDPVAIGAVGREVYYFQSGPGAPALDLDDDEQFGSLALLFGESVHELASGAVILPGGEERAMSFDSQDNDLGVSKSNATFDALLADFPDGDYTLRYQIAGGAQVDVSVNLGNTFPSAPQISNWTEAQSVLASEPFTIEWLPIDGMTETDAIAVYVEDPFGGDLFVSDVYFVDPAGLRGTAVSVTIPAGTLQEDQTYFVSIDALKFTDIDESREGQVFAAFNLRSTGFNLTTIGGNQPPAITTDFLDDAEEGQAYSFDVVASDPEDGSSVTMAAMVIPSWLAFSDLGNGSLRLTGTPIGANIGEFTVTVSATDSQGLVTSREYSLAVNPDLSDPEGRALDIVSINWIRDQASPFVSQIADVQFGESALISGPVGDGATSFLRGTFTGPLKLSFYWKVSSEAGQDLFRVSVDDTVEAEISGQKNWRQQIIDLPAGNHSVVWAYEKNGSGSAGADRGWLDHVMILPAEAGSYAGTYLGAIASSTGEVSLFVRPNNTAVFLGYHPESGKGLSNFAFDVSDLGSFSFEVVNPDDMNSNYTVTGSIDNGVATGSVSGLNLTFTANLVSGGGNLVSYDGYYQNALTSTTSGLVYLIVATDGQAYFFAEDRDYVEGFITTIDALGNIALMTQQGFDYDLQVDPSTDIVAGTFTPPGGVASNVLGIREGSPGDELLANISTRGKVLTGGKIMIASFVINGTGSKQLLIRAIGPKLSDFSVPDVLEDPVIELVRLGELDPMLTNDDWEDGAQATEIVQDSIRLGAFALNPGGRDAVMKVSLEPDAYTVKVRGSGGLTGVGLVEVYDADDPTERLATADVVNIATRGEVGIGGDALIAGFVVSGDVPKRILLRGIGPQLTQYGVGGVLSDPRIDLTNATTKELVASNDNWGDNPDVAAVISSAMQVGAFALDDGSKDAALLIWLEPGAYTAKVSGADGGTGVALIEVYDN